MNGPSTPSLLLLDSGLRDDGGHHRHFATGMVGALSSVGWHARILSHRGMTSAVAGALGAVPTFERSLYDHIARDPYDGGIDDHALLSAAFARDMADAPLDASLILLPTATAAEIEGLARWLFGVERPQRVAAIFHWGNAASWARGTVAATLLRSATKQLVSARPAALWFGATRQELAEALTPILGRQVELVPSLTFFGAATPLPSAQTDKIRLILPGAARPEKGSGILVELAAALGGTASSVQLVVHTGADTTLAAALRRHSNVEVVSGWIDENSFADSMVSADAVLLPYDARVYRNMVSGIFTLAAGLGRPVLVPRGTWMADRLIEGDAAGAMFEHSTVPAILEAVDHFLRARTSLQEKALALAPAWRSRYGAESLVHHLISWTAGETCRQQH